jgi:hypothetical protein
MRARTGASLGEALAPTHGVRERHFRDEEWADLCPDRRRSAAGRG